MNKPGGPERPTDVGADERDLVGRARQGDKEALAELYRRHKDGLFGFALGIVGRRAQAEDIVQEVFARFLRNGDSLRADGAFKSFLFSCAHNLAIDSTRRFANRALPLVDEDSIPFEAADVRDEDLDRLRRLILDLPVEQREVVMLKVHESMTIHEIAAALDVAVGTVSSRYNYALDRMRRAMEISTGAKKP